MHTIQSVAKFSDIFALLPVCTSKPNFNTSHLILISLQVNIVCSVCTPSKQLNSPIISVLMATYSSLKLNIGMEDLIAAMSLFTESCNRGVLVIIKCYVLKPSNFICIFIKMTVCRLIKRIDKSCNLRRKILRFGGMLPLSFQLFLL